MHTNEVPVPPETPSVPPEAPPPPPPPKVFGKKLYLVIGLIAVAAVASAFTIMYLVPKGEAVTIPLGLNYSVGEKMTYEVTITITISATGQTIPQTGTISMEVLSFDGVNYTINYTVLFQTQEFSYTVKMNKTGHIIDYSGLPPEFQQFYSAFASMPGYGSYFPKEVVKVGETWQIPINISYDGFSLMGTVNSRVSETKNVTVPAGTYNVFRTDITATNVQGTYIQGGVTVNLVLSMNGYAYSEIGTCCPVDFNIQESVTATSMGYTVSMSLTMRMRLTEHIK